MAQESRLSASEKKFPKENHTVRNLIVIGGVGAAIILTLIVLRFTMYVPYRVPSGSMRPTIDVNEHVLANAMETTPVRGAVVVFEYPEHPSQLFMKRIIGVSGDKIAEKNGRISINGWDIPHCDVGPMSYKDEDMPLPQEGNLEVEYLGDFVYLVFHMKDTFGREGGGPWVVRPGEYFVIGDNRENAHDSRFWFGGQGGGVPFANSKGRLRLDPAHPKLPPGAESSRAAFEACLKSKPPVTSPPAGN